RDGYRIRATLVSPEQVGTQVSPRNRWATRNRPVRNRTPIGRPVVRQSECGQKASILSAPTCELQATTSRTPSVSDKDIAFTYGRFGGWGDRNFILWHSGCAAHKEGRTY